MLNGTLHLDEPMWLQYARFLRGLATLGVVWELRKPPQHVLTRDLIGAPKSAASTARVGEDDEAGIEGAQAEAA